MSPELALVVLHSDFDRNRRKGGLRPDGPNGGVADTLDEAKAALVRGWAGITPANKNRTRPDELRAGSFPIGA